MKKYLVRRNKRLETLCGKCNSKELVYSPSEKVWHCLKCKAISEVIYYEET